MKTSNYPNSKPVMFGNLRLRGQMSLNDNFNSVTRTEDSLWNLKQYLYYLLPYMHLKGRTRVIYLLCTATILSLLTFEVSDEYFLLKNFTGKHSIFNQAFVKWGWAWTLGLFITFRLSCLPLRTNWVQHFWHLAARASVTTLFFYIWCQGVFPSIEQWTGECKKEGIVVKHLISKKQCLRRKNHEFDSFDTSGHAFLLSYCIFVLMEESKEFLYVLGLLEDTNEKINQNSSEPRKTPGQHFYVFPIIILSLLSLVGLSLLWDGMLIVTNIFYHTIAEKLIGTILAIGTWYVLYPICFTAFEVL